ncbi:CTP synthase [Candidatus Kaiserbacteria bacterium RIFCSPHIGHO2_02_FULL_49_16]|uniref:CTP synthase n=2 Tax=Candidatus Kaiseribacteriota TaxID=1752734 RepID=A0A1F6DCQ7_9BACT|nr:MAG: CTP synthase [Candidatus Kaiserbacteria bacterium RIFCSPHIGHO2_02_FULL_49_16]
MRAGTVHKYIFIVGGVMSGVGKGIASSSIATLLKARGLIVTALKIDPYINVDAGTMNPTVHGEVFVLEDGLETDQDMGNYERFLNQSIPSINYMTTGSVYLSVIKRERNLEYDGKCVEVVPDIPLEVISRIEKAAEDSGADVTTIEIGGTVGEYQNILFLEAIRMMKTLHPDDVATVLVSYLPVPNSIGEMKTKPTQYAARTLNGAGVFADIIIARAPIAIDEKRRQKIALFCNVKPENVISAPDVKSIYDVPLNFEKDNLSAQLCEILKMNKCSPTVDLKDWEEFVSRSKNGEGEVKIAVVGKYFDSGDFVLSDVYISVLEAIKYSCYAAEVMPVIDYISSSQFEKGKNLEKLTGYNGVLVPGGFGETGIEGKIRVIQYAREKKIPYFGLCYGMQLMTVEFARNVAELKDAHTTEINEKTTNPVIAILPEQIEKMAKKNYGGTMRLGAYPCELTPGSIAQEAYAKKSTSERHRHRYEVNPEYIEKLEKAGLVFSGRSPDGVLMEIAELPKSVHPFFLGTQFHPEFLARPLSPHPLFNAFIKAAVKQSRAK